MLDADLHHVSLPLRDLARPSAFYERVFGLQRIARPPSTSARVWYGLGARQLHLVEYAAGSFRTRGPDSADTHFALRTTDFEGWIAHLTALGFREDVPDTDANHLLVKRTGLAGFPQLFLTDPDRNTIEINAAP